MVDAQNFEANWTEIEITANEDGGLTATGTVNKTAPDVYINGKYGSPTVVYPSGEKTFSAEGLSADETIFLINGNSIGSAAGNMKVTRSSEVTCAMIRLKNGKTYDHAVIYPMLNAGSDALPWQPYTGKTVTISTPTGLPGIPVDSGGNYTDSTGQQWICDEYNAATGRYTTRTFVMTLDGSLDYSLNSTGNENLYQYVTYLSTKMDSTNSKAILSDRFAPGAQLGSLTKNPGIWISSTRVLVIVIQKSLASTVDELKQWFAEHPTKVLLPLAEPEVSTIATEQLTSYSGVTTAYTNAGAELSMTYVADTQKYIDNKIAAISAAMLEG